jgi:hypothetical protein
MKPTKRWQVDGEPDARATIVTSRFAGHAEPWGY